MKFTGYNDCKLCHGNGTYQDSYFDVGDVKRRYFDQKCWKCYVKWLQENDLGTGVRTGQYGGDYYTIFEWDEEKQVFIQYSSKKGRSVFTDVYWTPNQLILLREWILNEESWENT